MKTIIKYMAIAASAVALYGCQDEHDDINTHNLPSASDINVELQMLDSNRVRFNLLNQGNVPIWHFSDGSQSTENGFVKQFLMAGDYSVEVKMYNKNGVSEGSITKEFSFTETFANYDNEIAILTSGSESVWQIAKDVAGHVGCGENQANPTGWYSAESGEKDGTGLYDDKFIFNADGTYTYNPGDDGLTYVNVGTTALGNAPGTEDFDAPNSEIKGTWKLEYRGSQLYLVLSPKTVLGYLADDAQWNAPEFAVTQVSAKKITLVWNGNGISWQYIIAPYSEAPQIENLWSDDLEKYETYYNPGWAVDPISDQLSVVQNGGVYKISAPIATSDTWQSQVKLLSNVSSAADKVYDFSVMLTPNANHDNVTVKLTETGNDENFLFEEKVSIEAGKPNEVKFTAKQGVDAAKLTLVFDFGWNPENFEVTVSDITFGESVSGPIDSDPEPIVEFEENPEGSILSEVASSWQTATYHGAADWSALNDFTVTKEGTNYKIHFTNSSDAQWKAQFRLVSQYLTKAGEKFDIRIKVKSDKDISKATFKLLSMDEQNANFTGDGIRKDIEADEVTEFIVNGFSSENDMEITTRYQQDGITAEKLDNGDPQTGGLTILFDFGGNPEDCNIEIFDIAIQKSK